MEKLKNDCVNCVYCAKHYTNLHGTFELVLGCMHCINSHMPLRERKKRMNNEAICNYFEPERVQVEQRHKRIESTLRVVADRLNEIAQILELEIKK